MNHLPSNKFTTAERTHQSAGIPGGFLELRSLFISPSPHANYNALQKSLQPFRAASPPVFNGFLETTPYVLIDLYKTDDEALDYFASRMRPFIMKTTLPSFVQLALLLSTLALGIAAALQQSTSRGGSCRNPIVRKEWYSSDGSLQLFILIVNAHRLQETSSKHREAGVS
jgi:hypothetical protein